MKYAKVSWIEIQIATKKNMFKYPLRSQQVFVIIKSRLRWEIYDLIISIKWAIITSIEHLSWPNWTIKIISHHKNDFK